MSDVPEDTGATQEPIDLSGLMPQRVLRANASSSAAPPHDPGLPVAIGPAGSLDATREKIAYILLGTLGAVIALEAIASTAFAVQCGLTAQCTSAQSAMGLITGAMTTIFTAMVGLVGSVVGFYFGSQKQPG